LAVYTAVPGVEREFQRAAESFAADHRSFAARDGRLIFGRHAAVPANSTQEVVAAVTDTLRHIRGVVSNARIDTLALFAHGVNASRMPGGRSYINLTGGHQITNSRQLGHGNAADQLSAADFVAGITAALSNEARIVLYACELGDAFQGGESGAWNEWGESERNQARQGALADEDMAGDTSFADDLRDLLNATHERREVWGHRTTGHTTGNPQWRRFGPGTEAGAESDFGEEQAGEGLTPAQGWSLNRRNLRRASGVVRDLARRLRVSSNLQPGVLQRLERRPLQRWIARELPFAPTPFVTGEPPVVREVVVTFLEGQANRHEGRSGGS
jgi:hypothetical protein